MYHVSGIAIGVERYGTPIISEYEVLLKCRCRNCYLRSEKQGHKRGTLLTGYIVPSELVVNSGRPQMQRQAETKCMDPGK